MFERFDPDARAAIAKAKEEAVRAGRREIGTEHLLLGLMDKPGDATDAFEAVQADPDEVRAVLPQVEATRAASTDAPEAAPAPEPEPEPAAEPRVGEQARAALDMHLTRNARRALDLALRTAHRFRHDHVSSGHLLLSIMEQPDSGAVEALKVAGIHVGTLRTDILKQLTEDPGPAKPARQAQAPQAPAAAPTQD